MKPALLRSVCEFQYGKSLPSAQRRLGQFPVFGSNGRVGTHDEPLTRSPTIVIGRKGSVGEVNYSDQPCWPIDTTYYIDQASTSANLRWLYHALKWLRLPELNKATGVPGLNRNDAYERRLFVPTPIDQERIATILDKADAIRCKREQALALADDLLKSAFEDMFGDLASNSANWPAKKISDVVSKERPVTYGILMPGPDLADGVPYIRVTDLREGGVAEEQVRRTSAEIAREYRRSTLRAGDLLISIRGHVGRLAFVPPSLDGANITQDTARLAIPDQVDAIYVRSCLESKAFQRVMAQRTKGGAVQGINLGDLKQISVPMAPVKLRRSYAKFWSKTQSAQTALKAGLMEAEAFFASLTQRAFRGEL